eukprot:TRINITY_DN5106_c0_g1_i1.p1 TRINITY_DN5106_c0_g1~~TRINITY_DN5106_c0_g1_i1.p1  ORF type:complete len:112 (+),score=10.04 TRINITY_DN5106_c0_g1_i1:93-428(+)
MYSVDTVKRLLQDLTICSLPAFIEQNGITVESIDDDLSRWHVRLSRFGNVLDEDLRMFSMEYVLLHVTFPQDYPSLPPFIRVISPKFKFHTGHGNSSICLKNSPRKSIFKR